MRIAYVTPGLLPLPPVLGGSVETYVDQLTQVLSEHEITVYSGGFKTWAKEEQVGNVRHVRCARKRWQLYLQQVCRHLAQNNYQIIQVENRPGFVPAIVQAASNSKVILNLHSLNFVKNAKDIAFPIGYCLERAHLITVNSHYLAKQLKVLFPGLGTPVVICHLGTEPTQFVSRWEEQGGARRQVIRHKLRVSRKKVVLFAGRIIPTKGIHVLMRAMQIVARRYPGCVLVIAGGADFGTKRQTFYMKKLQALSQKSKFKTIFLKAVKHATMPDYYLAADVLVCPSTESEAFGLVNVEAMAAGLPVVGSNVGGIPEVVASSQSGLLVPPKAYLALSKALSTVLGDAATAQRMGRFGRLRVEEYFNWTRVGREMEQHYTTLSYEELGGRGLDFSQCRSSIITLPEAIQADSNINRSVDANGLRPEDGIFP